jgi:predicted PurR-regulated permease PerM
VHVNQPAGNTNVIRLAVEISITLLIIFLILGWCLQILSPFLGLIIWGAVIATAVYPAFLKLKAALGDRGKLAIAVFVLVSFGIVIVPLWSFGGSVVDAAVDLRAEFAEGSLEVPPPSESVRDWPVVGELMYETWSAASTNLTEFALEHSGQLRNVAATALGKAASAGKEALLFLVSITIAAAFLASADAAAQAMRRLFRRLSPANGDALLKMSVATVRSVAVGVLGVAVIQSLLAGIGFAVAGVPAAGVWALLVLILAIAQLPPILILLPVAVYVFSVESTTVAVTFLVWSILVSLSDAVLKPVLLGRGLDTPMLVVLLGAIGGMITSGIIGLFVGAVVLSVGYKLFQTWLESGETDTTAPAARPAETA